VLSRKRLVVFFEDSISNAWRRKVKVLSRPTVVSSSERISKTKQTFASSWVSNTLLMASRSRGAFLAGKSTVFSEAGFGVDVESVVKKNLITCCLAKYLWIGLVLEVKTKRGSMLALLSFAKLSTTFS
jgi:hypothetical protein